MLTRTYLTCLSAVIYLRMSRLISKSLVIHTTNGFHSNAEWTQILAISFRPDILFIKVENFRAHFQQTINELGRRRAREKAKQSSNKLLSWKLVICKIFSVCVIFHRMRLKSANHHQLMASERETFPYVIALDRFPLQRLVLNCWIERSN